MWILESAAHPENITHSILGDHKYVVGRQNCDIIVADPSVSRRQAVLTMAHYETNVAKSFIVPTLTLEDVSKFGTFVNGKPVKTAGGNTVTLKENDQIKFGGTPASVYRARYRPFLATTSCLEKGPKKALQRVMCLLGGHLVRDWRPTCDLLIMSKINVTLKVICAINNQKHIVTPKYLDDLHQHLMSGTDKPDPRQYLPEVVDQEVPPGVSFHPDKRRQTLLEGLKFYFLSPLQFNKTNLAVSTAGGQPILLEDGSEEDAEGMTQDGTVVVLVTKDVMDTLSPASAKFVRTVITTLRRKNLRMITDPEIGTAILTCNMADYCNPRTALAPNLQAAMASQLMMSQIIETDSSQISCPQGPVASRDIKPKFRSNPVPPVVSLTQPAQITSEGGDIKPEEISHQGDHADGSVACGPGRSGNNAMAQLCPRPAPGSSKFATPDLQRSKPGDTPCEDAPAPGESFRLAAKEGSSWKSGAAQPSQSSSDLFADGSAVSESRSKSSEKNRDQRNSSRAGGKQDSIVSVFARQRMKKRENCVISSTEDDNDVGVGKSLSKQKRTMSLFDDDDEEDSDNNKVSEVKQSVKPKRKFLFDVDSDEDISGGKTVKRNCKVDVSTKGSDSTTGAKTYNVVQDSLSCSPAERNSSPHLANIDSKGMATSADSNRDAAPEVSKAGADNSGLEERQNSLAAPACHPRLGWVSVASKKINGKSEVDSKAGLLGEDGDVKPDLELLRDATGKVLRNLCEVEVAELVVRQPRQSDLASKPCQDTDSRTGNQKNFKRFKKTEHAGSGKLPNIIGGRDLEEHRGSVHKDLEDLFTRGIARQNEEDDEERQNKDLFDWDTKTRKGVTRKIR
ncbi:hypothetical protein EGW08_015657 [Elysia chlorotica]|uniref:Nibrin n=1 Tax=Elysia chlorotica TaxID=188477 RepID=A0A3S0ZDQ6_ELYCH|nr:hypothetical protein EGW08_015657 [Elysia chlorotica]